MKMLKKNGGFTLVELIIVIAILAILAGVAVPAYSGYIAKANDAAVMTELDALKTAVFAANAESTTPITAIEVTTTASAITITVTGGTGAATGYDTFYTTTAATLNGLMAKSSYKNGATWNSTDGWEAK